MNIVQDTNVRALNKDVAAGESSKVWMPGIRIFTATAGFSSPGQRAPPTEQCVRGARPTASHGLVRVPASELLLQCRV